MMHQHGRPAPTKAVLRWTSWNYFALSGKVKGGIMKVWAYSSGGSILYEGALRLIRPWEGNHSFKSTLPSGSRPRLDT